VTATEPQLTDGSAAEPQLTGGSATEPRVMDAAATGRAAGQPVATSPAAKHPLYPRLLRLRHVHPNAWQRALLGEGAVGLAGLLVLADLATAWILVVLPLSVAVVVKAHDLLAARLEQQPPED
jgi:hypothetical protein